MDETAGSGSSGGFERVTSKSTDARISTELALRRTGMAFQRTRLAAESTRMSVIRTSLSLIGFGFTIYQVFQKAHEANLLKGSAAPRTFGEALVFLGIGLLVLGIAYHIAFMRGLRKEREQLKIDGLVHAESHFPVSMTLVIALLLLVVGVLAVTDMLVGAGPLG